MMKKYFNLSWLCAAALCGVFALASTRGTAQNATAQNAANEKPYRVTRRIALHDARINESSGLARSFRHPNFLWTHNDSGDAARIFLVDERGDTRAVVNLEGAKNLDWEDSATGPRETNGAAWIYLADIGDNDAKRPNITIYRFREPALSAASTRAPKNAVNVAAPQLRVSCEAMTLRYPDGAHDAETLIIAPDNRVVLVTKSLGGSTVFIAPQHFKNGATQTLRALGELQFSDGGFFGFLATGGDISADGTRVVIRTYTHFYEWRRDARDNSDAAWRALFRRAPKSFAAPESRQGEAVCYDARNRLFFSSEKLPAPLVTMEK